MPYSYTDVFVLCFAVDNPDSLSSIITQWVPEVRNICPNAPLILVCNKIDLRNDVETIDKLANNKCKPISREEGLAIAQRIDAVEYLECSARNNDGVREVFEAAIRTTLYSPKQKGKSKCIIL